MHEVQHEYQIKGELFLHVTRSPPQGQTKRGRFSFQNWMICDPYKSFKRGWFVNIMIYHPNLDDVMPVFYNVELQSGTWMICTTQILMKVNMIATHPKGNVLYSPFSDDYASSKIWKKNTL